MTSKYPRALLAEVAEKSTSLVDLMHRVGAPMGSKPHGYLRQRLAHYGIDTSHFKKEPLPERPKRSYAKEILSEAAANCTCIREMFVYMGIPPEDGPYQHVKRRLERYGIDTSHFVPPRSARDSGLLPERELIEAVAVSHSFGGSDAEPRVCAVRRPGARQGDTQHRRVRTLDGALHWTVAPRWDQVRRPQERRRGPDSASCGWAAYAHPPPTPGARRHRATTGVRRVRMG